jgi:hypothetical protein
MKSRKALVLHRENRLAFLIVVSLASGCPEQRESSQLVKIMDAGPAKTAPRVAAAPMLTGTARLGLIANDRWGNPVNTTFESRDYLVAALPVLERQLTAEDFERLKSELAVPR